MADRPSQPRTARAVKILLGLSLALNLLVLGLVAGTAWRQGHGPRDRGAHAYAAPYVMALPRETRRALMRDLRSDHPRLDRAARRDSYAAMVAALRAEPFDPATLESVLRDQRDTAIAVQQDAQARWLGIVSRMDAAGRAAYATRLEEVLARGPNRRRRDGGGGDGG